MPRKKSQKSTPAKRNGRQPKQPKSDGGKGKQPEVDSQQRMAMMTNAIIGIVDGVPQQDAMVSLASAVARVCLSTNVTTGQFAQLLAAQVEPISRELLSQVAREPGSAEGAKPVAAPEPAAE